MKSRRGAILVLAAILITVMLGMAAFAVDSGMILVGAPNCRSLPMRQRRLLSPIRSFPQRFR